jgi:hypothetical protein
MDIGEVENLAARLDGNARALTAVAGVLGGLVTDLERRWLGPGAAAFARDFETSHRPALLAAAQTLSELHARLVVNIDQQQAASSAATEGGGAAAVLAGAAGGGLLGVALHDAGGAWDGLNTGAAVEGLAAEPIDAIRGFAGVHSPGDDLWDVLGNTKAASWLRDSGQLQSMDQFLADSHVYTVTDKLGDAGAALAVIGGLVDVGEGGRDVYDGDYAAAGGQAVNAAAAGLTFAGPAGPLAGFDLELAKQDYDEITMGGPLPSPTLSNLTHEYIPDFTYLLPEEAWEEKGSLLKLI